ncbi:MAG: nucleotidyl transferase AbiEii/AbiGii toxin family protein, partial [Bacteroidales bacterium]|nr:nucleotidyl transferase AbiEii/AbiGii toxin family protein [Bacteroidales bacterium]
RELFLEKLRERFATADIEMVKQDVLPYLRDTSELDIWSNDYFLQLADMIVFQE